ncbi:spore germination protein [Cohnella panacarvi]|uniref:spore germination protein n=1 Tax=Cohnella panacarvi TaxID=400776 RepID=UPI00047DBF83|nr:spore germination protein [Cohnella panacarvi]
MIEKNNDLTPDIVREMFQGIEEFKMKRYELGDGESPTSVYLLYCEGMIQSQQINETVIPKLDGLLADKEDVDNLELKMNISRLHKDELVLEVFSGRLVMYFDLQGVLYGLDLASIPQRQPQESNTETAVKGSRDAFVEELLPNISLIRKRLRTNSLRCERFMIGKRSHTAVALLYIQDIANPDTIEEAKNRLNSIDIDSLMGSSPLEELIADSPNSLFPLVGYTTRPDFAVDSLIRGRFVVIADGAPTAVIAPANLFYMLRSAEDAYFSYLPSSFSLIFRYVGLLISLFLPGFYIAITSFNVEQLPYPLLATIGMSRIGLPFPGPLEAFLMVGMFEVFREAGERLPKAVGSTVSVVGGIVVGEAAIRAGLASSTLIVVAAITGVASFTLVNQTLVLSVSITRIVIMIFASFLGMYGFMIAAMGLLLYLASLSSFGLPYLAPLTPVTWRDLALVFSRVPWVKKNFRPQMLNTVDDTRQKRRS